MKRQIPVFIDLIPEMMAGAAALLTLYIAALKGATPLVFLLVTFLVYIMTPVWLGRVIKGIICALSRRPQQTHWGHYAIIPIVLIATFGLAFTNLPMLVMFQLSRPALEKRAQQHLSGQVLTDKTSVGLYPEVETEVIPGGVRFTVARGAFFLSGSYFGFAYFPDGKASESFPSKSVSQGFQVTHKNGPVRLNDKWFWWHEDNTIP